MGDPPQNFDRFKPSMPRIPGVSDRQPEPETAGSQSRLKLTARIAAPVLAGLAMAAIAFWWMVRTPRANVPALGAPIGTPQSSIPGAPGQSPAAATPVLSADSPVEVATIQEMAKPWSSRKFLFRKRLTDEIAPAILVRLPGAANHSASYWAFSLQAPFGHCELEYVIDLAVLASQYGYRARHPMVADPCTRTVYDPLRFGTLVGGAWARGDVVQGSGIRPPLAIEVRLEGNRLVVAQIE